jgi:hypothetical protein
VVTLYDASRTLREFHFFTKCKALVLALDWGNPYTFNSDTFTQRHLMADAMFKCRALSDARERYCLRPATPTSESEKHWADVTAVFAAATIVPAKEREQAWRLLETAASAKSMRVRIVALQTRARILEEEEKEEIRHFWNEQQEEAKAKVAKAGAKLLEAMAMTEKAREKWERALKREKDISSRLIDAPRTRKSLFSCFARNRGTEEE